MSSANIAEQLADLVDFVYSRTKSAEDPLRMMIVTIANLKHYREGLIKEGAFRTCLARNPEFAFDIVRRLDGMVSGGEE